ncbi:MAG: MBL fold metallo-hydrolase [Alphaproteobacteria bacterium]|nr:MBL fold metallo-hydrolase [Alphaproteobacteria bacterium]
MVLGCGDAFGNGGRFQTCFMVSHAGGRVLIDCGASSLIALKKHGIDPGEIDAVLLTHLHGDHFGGLPFLIIDAQFTRRERPLIVTGPPGTATRLDSLMEVMYPGSTKVERRFDVDVRELDAEVAVEVCGVEVMPIEVAHACGCPPYGLRVTCAGRTIAYSGDTGWTESLIPLGRDTDLFIIEASMYDKPVKHHLDYMTLKDQLPRVGAHRVMLTHMGTEMLAHRDDADYETAEDGLRITL